MFTLKASFIRLKVTQATIDSGLLPIPPFFFRAAPARYGSSQAGVELELQLPAYSTATASARSELHLRPMLYLVAMLDPSSTEQG